MFEIFKVFISGSKQLYRICARQTGVSGIIIVILLFFSLFSCARKPTTGDMKSIRTVQFQVIQKYTDVKADITLPLNEILSEFFKAMDVKNISTKDSADAVLTINLNGRPINATFPEITFYERAVVNGSAKLAIKGLSSKKVDLYGIKHFFGGNDYTLATNTDPSVPLMFASKRAFIKMLLDLWGPPALLFIQQTSLADFVYTQLHELDEIIENKDAPAFVPVIYQALQSQNTSIRKSAILMLDELTMTQMSPAMRNAVLKDLSPVIQAVQDENGVVRISARNVLSYLGQDANAAIPALIQALKSNDISISQDVYIALTAITGKKFGISFEKWQAWWKTQEKE